MFQYSIGGAVIPDEVHAVIYLGSRLRRTDFTIVGVEIMPDDVRTSSQLIWLKVHPESGEK